MDEVRIDNIDIDETVTDTEAENVNGGLERQTSDLSGQSKFTKLGGAQDWVKPCPSLGVTK